jgi:hypothetical protein
MTRLADAEIIFLACWLLLLVLVAYAWLTRTQREPGRHRYPDLPPAASHPYPELSPFPALEAGRVQLPERPKHLASTGELRQLAYDGDMDAINAEVTAWRALLPGTDTTDWTTAA